jgi:hypothetical protein
VQQVKACWGMLAKTKSYVPAKLSVCTCSTMMRKRLGLVGWGVGGDAALGVWVELSVGESAIPLKCGERQAQER